MQTNVDDILRKACWSNVQTFYKHYQKEIIAYEEEDFSIILKN